MTDAFRSQSRTLVVGVKGRLCAVPLSHVIEIMRPLPVEPISSVPSFVQGISIIRGIPTPVVDLLLKLSCFRNYRSGAIAHAGRHLLSFLTSR
jgi:chemotaxis signal transduction protein